MTWSVGQILTAAQLETYLPQAPLTTWSPSWNNVTVGNGVITTGYARAGALIVAQFRFTLGSTSSVSGAIQFTLPVNCDPNRGGALGICRMADTSASETYAGHVVSVTASTAQVQVLDSTNATSLDEDASSGTSPMTWANTDVLDVNLCYLAP